MNINKRLYPKGVLQREVKKFVKQQVEACCALGELDHPAYEAPTFRQLNLVNVSHQVLSVKWKGNALWGFIEVRKVRLVQHCASLGVFFKAQAATRYSVAREPSCWPWG